jgi:hypothetical protein
MMDFLHDHPDVKDEDLEFLVSPLQVVKDTLNQIDKDAAAPAQTKMKDRGT